MRLEEAQQKRFLLSLDKRARNLFSLTSFSVHSPYVILYLMRYDMMGEFPISELIHLSVIESEVTRWTRMVGGRGGTEKWRHDQVLMELFEQ